MIHFHDASGTRSAVMRFARLHRVTPPTEFRVFPDEWPRFTGLRIVVVVHFRLQVTRDSSRIGVLCELMGYHRQTCADGEQNAVNTESVPRHEYYLYHRILCENKYENRHIGTDDPTTVARHEPNSVEHAHTAQTATTISLVD
eukprot:145942_1